MRAVILFDPKINVEGKGDKKKGIKGASDYAEASLGFDFNGTINDEKLLAKYFRELADMLEAPTIEDKELI